MSTDELDFANTYVDGRVMQGADLRHLMAALVVISIRIAYSLGVDREKYMEAVQYSWDVYDSAAVKRNTNAYN
jgi:hypothetical protein